ncbi:hypothetical protein ECG_08882 [Echinococcus granulosus]|uniref:Uncharacterized protein n=1 Tax=Echinococcus granulosus TaxID=6210 RepID=A0A068WZ06_ECHGR|nr:hypothetical protein ECG_08882 [Echinococcus granulosus]CDS23749.1 hypothetical protein EgrG_002044900 [Echinococcus granulosus]
MDSDGTVNVNSRSGDSHPYLFTPPPAIGLVNANSCLASAGNCRVCWLTFTTTLVLRLLTATRRSGDPCEQWTRLARRTPTVPWMLDQRLNSRVLLIN